MAEIVWGENRTYHSGVDRGVIYPPEGPAVAWNGLISVDEESDQDVASYYVDGRKYLTVVSPRDYAASITAYTFPDVLSDLCGIVEAADGLLLDSQAPGRFALSYRTLVNGGTSYRIHIIYDAIAAMEGVSFNTHGESNDPTPFSFSIDAIPQSINGYRPTAHAIIDTTNLSPEAVHNIEKVLYGMDGEIARVPTLQSLYDSLNFGDLLIIREQPSEGTFTIEGSRKYINVNKDGSFEVTGLTDDQVEFTAPGVFDLTITP